MEGLPVSACVADYSGPQQARVEGCCCFFNVVSLCSPGWTGTCVDQASLTQRFTASLPPGVHHRTGFRLWLLSPPKKDDRRLAALENFLKY